MAGSETRQAKAPPPEPKYEAKSEAEFEPKYEAKRESELNRSPISGRRRRFRIVDPPVDRVEPERAEIAAGQRCTRAVAILKSGVVDGMGYTLYVDGSIEAELPQGTLRFASINELRGHLEKNS